MSERYRVKAEMLEAWLKEAREIIAKMELKLRAADKLCEVANPIVEEISNFADNDLTEYLVIRFKDLVHLRKTIAEYEGKEKKCER